ncbi:MAG: EAL domain-containing protein [Campylobacterota bacterium]|nr:EAL domain-containing protein [Campylobacterota bacterium]
MLDNKWLAIVEKLDFAFQPIVHVKSGNLYALEALLRHTEEAGFYSIFSCFDEAFHEGVLYQFDLALRKKAFKKFSSLSLNNTKLFYNLDNRLLYMPDFTHGNTLELLEEVALNKNDICFELSERGTLQDPMAVNNMVSRYKEAGFSIAIDDFGTGISGLQLLYYAESNYIKLDRFFINNIESDAKKRLFCSSIITMAHAMGMKIIAEGLESVEEYYTCKDLGVDFLQGYFIQKPQLKMKKILPSYEHIAKFYKKDKRLNFASLINKKNIDSIATLNKNATLIELFSYFKDNSANTFVPIVDDYNYFHGVIYEKDIKKISYSTYGHSLAANNTSKDAIKRYIKSVVSVDISLGIDKTLEIYNLNEETNIGIFITKENVYFGFVDVNTLLKIAFERNIEIAKDQNPLSKLPGNSKIEAFILEAIEHKNFQTYHLLYCDFNDFKPFNDTYGFRQGDRAIVMFAELIRGVMDKSSLNAHIGGDDFFIGYISKSFEEVYEQAHYLQNEFKKSASSLYNKEDRSKGYISAKDRFGVERNIELLSVSIAIVEVNNRDAQHSFDSIIGSIKKHSKKSDIPLGISIL